MSDYLEDNPDQVKNAAYYRRQMKELERENAELKRIIAESKNKIERLNTRLHNYKKQLLEFDNLTDTLTEGYGAASCINPITDMTNAIAKIRAELKSKNEIIEQLKRKPNEQITR